MRRGRLPRLAEEAPRDPEAPPAQARHSLLRRSRPPQRQRRQLPRTWRRAQRRLWRSPRRNRRRKPRRNQKRNPRAQKRKRMDRECPDPADRARRTVLARESGHPAKRQKRRDRVCQAQVQAATQETAAPPGSPPGQVRPGRMAPALLGQVSLTAEARSQASRRKPRRRLRLPRHRALQVKGRAQQVPASERQLWLRRPAGKASLGDRMEKAVL